MSQKKNKIEIPYQLLMLLTVFLSFLNLYGANIPWFWVLFPVMMPIMLAGFGIAIAVIIFIIDQ